MSSLTAVQTQLLSHLMMILLRCEPGVAHLHRPWSQMLGSDDHGWKQQQTY